MKLKYYRSRMKSVNDSLQHQLVLARSTRLPMTEKEVERDDGEEAYQFAAALARRQNVDQ